MTDALERLKEEKIPFLLCGYSSLDRYFRVNENGPLYLATDSSLVSLAKAFDNLQFPGLPLEDASVQGDDQQAGLPLRRLPFGAPGRPVHRAAPALRSGPQRLHRQAGHVSRPARRRPWHGVRLLPAVAAALRGRPAGLPLPLHRGGSRSAGAGGTSSRRLPTSGTSLWGSSARETPRRALRSWTRRGSWRRRGPSLPRWPSVPHGKDFHPEGNVWEHTLATLTYRKRPDLTLSLALMLHDSGKPHAPQRRGQAVRRARGNRGKDRRAVPAQAGFSAERSSRWSSSCATT